MSGRVSRNGDAAAARRRRGGSATATQRLRGGRTVERLWEDCGGSCGRIRRTVVDAVTHTVIIEYPVRHSFFLPETVFTHHTYVSLFAPVRCYKSQVPLVYYYPKPIIPFHR